MTTNQELLDGEMGAPPPSTVDIDTVIVRQRRRVRLRQAGLIGSVGAMTLAIALVLTTLRPGGGAPVVVQPGESPSPTLTARQQEAARLTAALQLLMAEALPGAEFLPPTPDDFKGDPPTEPLAFADQGTHFLAAALIRDSAGIGTISVSVGKEDTQFRRDRECLQDPPPLDMRVDCDVGPGPGGAIIETVNNSSKYTDFAFHAAEIIRTDDNAVHVVVTNRSGDDQDEVFRPTPPLTFDQTVALAQSPDLATTLP